MLWPLTTEAPLSEKTWELLLHALSEDGRWAEVLVAFEEVRQVLVDELGIVPGPELRRLHQLALRADERAPHDAVWAAVLRASFSWACIATATATARRSPRAGAAALQQLGSSSAIVCTSTAHTGAVASYTSAGFRQPPAARPTPGCLTSTRRSCRLYRGVQQLDAQRGDPVDDHATVAVCCEQSGATQDSDVFACR